MFIKSTKWLLVLVTIGAIFYFSSEPSKVSALRTYKITQYVTEGIKSAVSINSGVKVTSFDQLHYYIRKGAHFFEYLLLSFLFSAAIGYKSRGSGRGWLRLLLICLVLACLDEGIQLVTAGRSGRIKDVLIDGAGALVGIMMYNVIYRVLNTREAAATLDYGGLHEK